MSHVELRAVLRVGIVQRNDFEAKKVVAVFDASGDRNTLDAAIGNLLRCQSRDRAPGSSSTLATY